MRQHASSGSPLEPIIGFSRAVRTGPVVVVAGTAPIGADGGTAGVGDVAAQTRRCFDIALAALAQVEAGPEHVTRTRMMLTDITRWRESADVHGEYFRDVCPACTFVEVKGFIDPEWLIEVEIDAFVPDL